MYIKKLRKKRIAPTVFVTTLLFLGVFGLYYGVYAYPVVFKAETILKNDSNISPSESLDMVFSEPMLRSSVENSLKIIPSIGVSYEWGDDNKSLKIKPDSFWQPQTEYQLSILNARSIMLTVLDVRLNFNTAFYPAVESFFPADGSKEVQIDIEEPIKADFDKPVSDYSIKITINPETDFAYELSDNKRQIRLMPKNELDKGNKYSAKVFIKYKKEPDNAYKKIFESSFETFTPLRPSLWDKNPEIKLTQAKENTRAKLKNGKYIDINLAQQVMVIFDNGKAVDAYLISSGKRGMETPVGDFQIRNKAPKPWSKKYSLFMPNWMALVPSGEFGIHELPEWPGGYKEGAGHLGTPVSHGCVRLGVGPAKRVYDWAEVGTPVLIYDYN